MQIQCPRCHQVLQITQAAEQFGCPACGAVIQLGNAGQGAGPGAAPGPAIDAGAAPRSTVAKSFRRKRGAPLALIAGVAIPVVVVAIVVIGLMAGGSSTPPPRALSPEDVAAQKAHELVAAELGVTNRAEFPQEGYTVSNDGQGKWSVSSYILESTRNEHELLKHGFEARLAADKDQWKLVSLTINGKRRDIGVVASNTSGRPFNIGATDNGSGGADDPGDVAGRSDEPLTVAGAAQRLAGEFKEFARLKPTTVVWIIDQTSSADSWRSEVVQNLAPIQQAMTPGGKLKMGVVGFAGKFNEIVTDEPVDDAGSFQTALEKVLGTKEGGEGTFTAIAAAAEKFGPMTAQEGGYLILVAITDEAGDDADRIDEVLPVLRSRQAVVHVFGKETPLGRAGFMPKMGYGQQPFSGADEVTNGPEAPYGELIHMGFWNMGFADPSEQLTSGFGPYALSRLCKETGGQFFAFPADASGRWRPGMAGEFDAKAKRKYSPPYMALADYEKTYGSNLAVQGLKEASKLPRLELAKSLVYDFGAVGDEASIKRALDMAQREVARIEPKLMDIYQPLKNGEKDRPKLTVPRLQAAYDLAMGRTLAARVRVEGYNQMLALLKQGKKFERETSAVWVLKESDKIDANNTQLSNMLRDAKMYLQRVVDDHPGTPWAYLAQQELQTRMGWEWDER